ncbi:MAG: PspC domain-containing protein, partial [Candidatus Saccharimonas sp.]
MKEITRIHIAKIPYDIETGAKKELERYIKNLGLYADDPEVMVDVEVRMTELLSARGIQKDGVITREDIDAIRAQLGEPHDFANENSDITLGSETEPLVNTPHRLYRDTDTPVLGGVLGGIARYFGIDPLWTRLGFLILCIPSMGTLFLAYMI